MQTISLHDTVTISRADKMQINCDHMSVVPDSNLALLAARALREEQGVRESVRIDIKKRIPIAAGLGGGASNAAAVLNALVEFWGLEISHERLIEIGASVGSDVPFLLTGGTALVRGKGDKVMPLPAASLQPIVILSPKIGPLEKTRSAFERVTPEHYTRGTLSHKLAGRIRGNGDVPPELFFNAFESLASSMYADYNENLLEFQKVGARVISLNGAGPSLFVLAPSLKIGAIWEILLRYGRGWTAFLTHSWQPGQVTKDSV
jgi:4-diphosphocytidyl-2-C-methyl-D-erythritol kinase